MRVQMAVKFASDALWEIRQATSVDPHGEMPAIVVTGNAYGYWK